MKESNKTFMVLFYAPWCGHCQQFKPQYEAAAKHLDGIVPLVAVDCTNEKNQKLCARYQVQGYPTVKLFNTKSSKYPLDYMDARTKKAVVSYVKREMKSPLIETKTLKDFEEKIKEFNNGTDFKLVTLLINSTTVPMQAYKICNMQQSINCLVKTNMQQSEIAEISKLLSMKQSHISPDKNNLIICKSKKNCKVINNTSAKNVKKILEGISDEL